MMLLLLGLSVMVLAACGAPAASGLKVGEPLPELRGEFLTGRTAVLPQAASGRVALLLLGFSYDSRFAVEAWAKKFSEEFEADSRVTYYEIPMIGGLARLGKWFINRGMRQGTPEAAYERVVTVYGGTDPWKQHVEFRDPDIAYLLLIDQSGAVAWRYAGNIDEDAYQALSSKVSKLIADD
jgi:hypothetical protein